MLSPTGALVVLSAMMVFALTAVSASVLILRRGRLYHKIKPEARPRRWVLFSLLILFGVFAVWFPVWVLWPSALVSKALTLLFGVTFFVVGITLKWFSALVDTIVKRKGWTLR